MSRRKRPAAHSNHERWLVSYADFITLLFAFFVVLYSSAQVDKQKVGKLATAIQVAFQQLGIFQETAGRAPLNADPSSPISQAHLERSLEQQTAFERLSPPVAPDPTLPAASSSGTGSGAGDDTARLMQVLEQALAPEIAKQAVRIRAGPDGIVLSLQEVGFYDPGSDILRPGAEEFLQRLVPILIKHAARLRIEGHTDNVPIHTARFPSNWELSGSRATGLVRLLIDKYSFPAERLSAAGYAEFHPVATNDTAEGRRLNRRVDVVILRPAKPSDDPSSRAAIGNSRKGAPLASTTSGLVTSVLSPSR